MSLCMEGIAPMHVDGPELVGTSEFSPSPWDQAVALEDPNGGRNKSMRSINLYTMFKSSRLRGL
jgi:hypothetical protein